VGDRRSEDAFDEKYDISTVGEAGILVSLFVSERALDLIQKKCVLSP
jgi:hypothetical protein